MSKITFKNKNIYLSPYNELSIKIEKELNKEGILCLGYIDNFKSGNKIYKKENILDFDYLIINSPHYWMEIAKDYEKDKIILTHTHIKTYVFYNDYLSILKEQYPNNYDILFLAYNKSNVIDASLVIRELEKYNYSCAVIVYNHQDYNNMKEGLVENSDINIVHIDKIRAEIFQALVCLIDWADKSFIKKCKKKGIKTIGLVDGIEDFEDSDYPYERNAYNTVEYVLTTGTNDMKYLEYKKDKCSIVGLSKLYDMWNTNATFPKEILVVINVNFTYGIFEEKRDMWLNEVLAACKELNIKYIISQHHADKSDLSNFHVSNDNIYETIKKGTLVISRFSTVISEALAFGKPVVYYNPHNEKVKLYKEPMGAYSISTDLQSLKEKILLELSSRYNVRQRAETFLHKQFNIKEKNKPAVLAADKINKIITKGEI